jgi:hypothetical protein
VKLPNYQQAIVADSKIVNYLLSEDHPKGKDKAVFFILFGFTIESWGNLKRSSIKSCGRTGGECNPYNSVWYKLCD